MADISTYPWVSHLRSESSSHVMLYRDGRRVRSGRGIAFWFSPFSASIVEVPIDDRDTDFAFPLRTQDFQVVSVQGALTWRTENAELLAERMDFTIHLRTGRLRTEPLDRIASLLIGLARNEAARYLQQRPVGALLSEGVGPLQAQMEAALTTSEQLAAMGLRVTTLRLAGITPTAELSRALETPTFERLQERADEATFARRALAVEKERAIAENELSTKVELARRQAALIEQEDTNERRRAEAKAEARRIEADADAARVRVLESANVEAERARLEAVRDVDPALLYALAARTFAARAKIDSLNVTPELAASIASALRSKSGPVGRAT